MICEDNVCVPIIQKAYKSYRVSFFEKVKCPVRCRVVVGR